MSQDRLVIRGGRALSGTIVPSGNKNAALPILAACLLTDEEVVLDNVPDILDVHVMLALLDDLGVSVRDEGPNSLALRADRVRTTHLDPDLCRRLRASLLLAGPLLARCGRGGAAPGRRRLHRPAPRRHPPARLPQPRRRLRGQPQLQAAATRGCSGADIFLDEASVTATENALMAAVTAPGRTVVMNAAGEPHVQDLARFLVELGARIDGIGTNRLIIDGVERLSGGRFRIGPDHIEIASFIGLGAITGSDLTIERRARRGPAHDQPDLRAARASGSSSTATPCACHRSRTCASWPTRATRSRRSTTASGRPSRPTSPASRRPSPPRPHGTVMIFEKMFENRLFFVDKLVSMGARIVLCDPHRAVVSGPAQLFGERLESPDIRAGMAMLIASLAAAGTSMIGNVGQIDRGYERIDERLQAVGADIERVRE